MTTPIDTNYTNNILSQLQGLKNIGGTSEPGQKTAPSDPVVPPADKTAGGTNETPALPKGNQKSLDILLANPAAVPSMGANVLAILQQLYDDSRRANNEARYQKQSTVIESMKDTAEQMRSNATDVLIASCFAAGVQCVAGVVSVCGGISTSKMEDVAARAAQMKWSGFNQALGAASSAISAGSEYLNTTGQATIKEMEAKTEQEKQMLEVYSNLNDSLKEVISKTNQAMNAIQQTENSTRTKIQS